MKQIFVAGAGTMGLEIALVFAQNGFSTTVYDVSDQILDRARTRLDAILDKQTARGRLDARGRAALTQQLAFSADIGAAADCELVLEAIVEDTAVKKALLDRLDAVCPPKTIYATNTSSLSITELASGCARADRVIGMHFFNPPTAMRLVEVIRGMNTSDETFSAVHDLAQALGKEPVEVAESPGFVVNRLLGPMLNDAANLVAEGVATPEGIDTAMRLGANHPMGPLALADMIGLDVCLAVMRTLYAETGDPKYRPSTLLVKMVRAGRLGRKSGRGFYQYN